MISPKDKMRFLRSDHGRTCALCPEWKPRRPKAKPPKPEPVSEVALADVSGPETPENFLALCRPCARLLELERAVERRKKPR